MEGAGGKMERDLEGPSDGGGQNLKKGWLKGEDSKTRKGEGKGLCSRPPGTPGWGGGRKKKQTS